MEPLEKTNPDLENSDKNYLVVLAARGGRIFGMHAPKDNRVLIGRSSKSHIRLMDPYFPRLAGEVILRPAPLIRIPEKGASSNRVIRLNSHKSLRLPPYNLFLIEEGGAIRNRKWLQQRKNLYKKFPVWKVIPATVYVVLILWGAFPTGEPDNGIMSKDVSAPFDISRFIEEVRGDEELNVKVMKKKPHITTGKQKSALLTTSPKTTRLKVDGGTLSEEVFAKNLESAVHYLVEGDGKRAGRCVLTILNLLSEKQRKQLVAVLEPEAEKIYRRAYILQPFDSRESEKIFRQLSESELEILPSVVKAKNFIAEQNR